jgi:UDPglucose 6-dehydrogenase
MKLAVIGTGYVGLTTGACLADTGNEVTCHDINRSRIEALAEGRVPFYEPGLAEMVMRNCDEGRLSFTTSLDEALRGPQVCFIAVGTPPDADGSADLSAVFDAARGIGQAMRGPLCVAVKSTVPVGTCEAPALAIIKRLTDAGASITAYDPEAIPTARELLGHNELVSFTDGPYEAASGADALLIATEWRPFRKPEFRRLRRLLKNPVIFDGRNLYEPHEMRELGFTYHCIGRAAR